MSKKKLSKRQLLLCVKAKDDWAKRQMERNKLYEASIAYHLNWNKILMAWLCAMVEISGVSSVKRSEVESYICRSDIKIETKLEGDEFVMKVIQIPEDDVQEAEQEQKQE